MATKRGLGRGLESIFADNYSPIEKAVAVSAKKDGVQTIRISEIEPKEDQPRKYFDTESLEALASSISQYGLLQPIIVRMSEGGFYQIIAGERRWRASKMANLTEIPAIVMEADAMKSAEVAIIENVQRENLNPYEEAVAYASLMKEFNLTQEEVSVKVGKSRPAIANTMRLLDLPDEVLELLKEGDISAGHARALLGLKDKSIIEDTAKKILIRSLSVRDTEALVKKLNKIYESAQNTADEIDDDDDDLVVDYIKDLERKAMSLTGKQIKIQNKGKCRVVQIEFIDNEDLEDILVKLCGNKITEE
ncbi:MAG: ParB/RepB/Spo0J family partition protein [Clostridia bacterium]|nr:ParB/RepB/Spo0J family partition protein [Clostridia bacterium]